MSYNSTSCSSGVRAAEIIAAALGKAGRSFPEDLLLSAKNLHLANPESTKKLARRAIKTVLKKSELQELWEESNEHATWVAVQEGLLERLS